MYNVIKIGEKDVPMLSMASVDIYYRNVFHEDPLIEQTKLEEAGDAIWFNMRMGFIMAEFAERKTREKMRELTEEDFVEWMDKFDRLDLMNALADIQRTYNGQGVTNSDAKKNTDDTTEQ